MRRHFMRRREPFMRRQKFILPRKDRALFFRWKNIKKIHITAKSHFMRRHIISFCGDKFHITAKISRCFFRWKKNY